MTLEESEMAIFEDDDDDNTSISSPEVSPLSVRIASSNKDSSENSTDSGSYSCHEYHNGCTQRQK